MSWLKLMRYMRKHCTYIFLVAVLLYGTACTNYRTTNTEAQETAPLAAPPRLPSVTLPPIDEHCKTTADIIARLTPEPLPFTEPDTREMAPCNFTEYTTVFGELRRIFSDRLRN